MSARQTHAWFTVLAVCDDGTSVSPLIAAVVDAEASRRRLEWNIVAAGSAATEGAPLPARAAAILQRMGAAGATASVSALTDDLIDTADLILTATVADRRSVVSYDPGTVSKTFTVRQFARFAEDLQVGTVDPDQRAGFELMRAAAAARAHLQPARAGEDDLGNPAGKGRLQYRRCLNVITREVDRMMRPIALQPIAVERDDRKSA